MRYRERKKIIFISRKPRSFGNFSLEIYFTNIINELSKENFEIKKIILPFTSDGFFKRLLNIIFCYFIRGDLYHLTGDINYVSLFLSKRKTITTIPDCARVSSLKGFRELVYISIWLKLPIYKSIIVTTISQFSKNEIIKYTGCNEDKIEVIPVSLNPIFKWKDKIFNDIKPRILQIGTQENKNIERIIEAISDIPCLFVIIGKLSDKLVNMLNFHNVQYLNFYNLSDQEMLEQYEICDIVTFVSIVEGFGVPIIEANSVGRVVVTSNTSSMPEVSNNAALIVDCFSVQEIKNSIIEIIKNKSLREQLILNGFKNIERYQNKKIVENYSQLYNKILSSN